MDRRFSTVVVDLRDSACLWRNFHSSQMIWRIGQVLLIFVIVAVRITHQCLAKIQNTHLTICLPFESQCLFILMNCNPIVVEYFTAYKSWFVVYFTRLFASLINSISTHFLVFFMVQPNTLLFINLKKSSSNEFLASVLFFVLKSICCFNNGD